jgi:hypothetical protein
VRYIYDNPRLESSFVTAFQLQAAHGSGKQLIAPLNTNGQTAIVEVVNVRPAVVQTVVEVFDSAGQLRDRQIHALPPHASVHVITDAALGGHQGMVRVQGSAQGSIVATVMQYGRKTNGGVNFMYGIQAVEPLGIVLRASYNTWLGQTARLWVVNSSGQQQTGSYSVIGSDGRTQVQGTGLAIAATGMAVTTLNVPPEQYGTVILQADTRTKPFAAWVTREAPGHVIVDRATQ